MYLFIVAYTYLDEKQLTTNIQSLYLNINLNLKRIYLIETPKNVYFLILLECLNCFVLKQLF